MLPQLYFNCTCVFPLQSCVPVRVKGTTVKQVDRSVHRHVKLWSLLWTHCYDPCYEHTGECWYPFIPTWCSFIPIWSCSLLCVLFAQSTLRSIRTQALSPVTWRSRKVRRSWWPRRKGSGGLGALITELESSPPITSDQKIQTWVHILTINTRYFLSILFCLHPAVRQWFWAEANVLDRRENPW